MSNILDNIQSIKKLDSKNMSGSIQLLASQVEQVWSEVQKVKIPSSYKKIKKIVVAGMGGSALGAHIIKSIFQNDLKIPLEIVNDYHLPGYVDSQTLVLISSYSGTTEEPLAVMKEAEVKKAKIMAICSGQTLAEWAKIKKIPVLIFSTEFNPCGSPRMGLGYSIFGQIGLFHRLGLIKIGDEAIKKEVLEAIKNSEAKFGLFNPKKENLAKQLSEETTERSVWFVASEHLVGNAHVAVNQMNENAKRFAGYFPIPELNHHLLEGMLHPKSNAKNLLFVFFESKLYNNKVQNRYKVTKDVLRKNNINHISYTCAEGGRLTQACEFLVFTSYLSFYSAMLSGIDPTAIPFVDYFKERMR